MTAFPAVCTTGPGSTPSRLRLAFPPGTDPLDVLDAARAAGRVVDFGLDLPTLSQLFLAAAGRTLDAAGVQGTRLVAQRGLVENV